VSVTVRFAPSPTGLLHIGNIRPALLNWLFARTEGGRYLLRYDDTDTGRSRPEYVAAIAEDLAWFGIRPDAVLHQSDRLAADEAAAERLKAAGRLYRCYETAEELERRRRRQLARGLPPIYDRAGLALTDADHARLAAEGRRPHWRFRLDGRPVAWDDLVRGAQTVETAALSDPVLVREDGTYLYTLTSVVDDADLGVTHIIRGEDHVTNTGVQIEIFAALGAPPPVFAHHNLIASASGEALSKRLGSLSIRSLREAGYEPMAVAALAVLTGSDADIRPYADLDELAAHVRLDGLSRSTARFDPHDLDALNAHLVHHLDHAAVADRLAALGIGAEAAADVDVAAFWSAVRANCTRVADALDWWRIVTTAPVPTELSDDDRAFCRAAFDRLPEEPWDDVTWGVWTKTVAAATGRKGRALFMPLRLALTGLDHGPELRLLLPLIGRRRTSARRP
jgi:glutamyl-tRNA synthetase